MTKKTVSIRFSDIGSENETYQWIKKQADKEKTSLSQICYKIIYEKMVSEAYEDFIATLCVNQSNFMINFEKKMLELWEKHDHKISEFLQNNSIHNKLVPIEEVNSLPEKTDTIPKQTIQFLKKFSSNERS